MRNLTAVTLSQLLPPSLTGDAGMAQIAGALDSELQALAGAIDNLVILPDLAGVPASLLDTLAWALHVDFYDQALTTAQKRGLVEAAITTHRTMGTPAAVESVARTVLGDAVVQEWFEYSGDPYYFRLRTSADLPDADAWARLLRMVSTVKNVRSHLQAVVLLRDSDLAPRCGLIIHYALSYSIGA